MPMKLASALLLLLLFFNPFLKEVKAQVTPPPCTWIDGSGNSYEGIKTGLGCIPVDAEALTKWIVMILIGVSGGIALLILILGGIQFISSSGDPDSIDEAKGKITSAVSGLILIVFSILILKIIGVDVLGLPGFRGLGGGGVELPVDLP